MKFIPLALYLAPQVQRANEKRETDTEGAASTLAGNNAGADPSRPVFEREEEECIAMDLQPDADGTQPPAAGAITNDRFESTHRQHNSAGADPAMVPT